MNVERKADHLAFECLLWRQSARFVAGVDEAGRGPLAGPVAAAALILPRTWQDGGWDERLRQESRVRAWSATGTAGQS